MNSIDLSKFLSFVLRHQPEAIGLPLDSEGWAEIDTLIEASGRDGKRFDRAQVMDVVETNDKKRFSISPDGRMIRAAQGHSTASVAMRRDAVTPPDLLFHGTATRFLDSILAIGLKPGARHHVHLSLDIPTATAVGKRHGKPVILEVAAGRMHAEGHEFHIADNGVWLTDRVAPDYLRVIAG